MYIMDLSPFLDKENGRLIYTRGKEKLLNILFLLNPPLSPELR